MGTDWFVKVKCPKPSKKERTREEHAAVCGNCPYVIWEKPQPVAGFMASMCGVRVGNLCGRRNISVTSPYIPQIL